MSLEKRPYRELRAPSLAGGMNDTLNETLLQPDQTPDPVNIEFNRETAQTAKGAIKFNNQIAPRAGFRTKVDRSFSPLYVDQGIAVPLRGYGYLPYNEEYDIGGDFGQE